MEPRMPFETYTEEDALLIDRLDSDFVSFTNGYKVQKWCIPSMIDTRTLKRCGYLSSMPNQLTPVSYFAESSLKNIAEREQASKEDLVLSGFYLIPAACIHFYRILEQQPSLVHNEIITTKSKVYRYENGMFFPGTRLWEFTVRELLAVGTADFVKSFLEDFKEKSLRYAQRMYSDAQLEVANDHFYEQKKNATKEKFQRINKLKYELIVENGDQEVALASFNSHGNHFSKEFGFDADGAVVSACVGYGLERWVSCYKKRIDSKNESVARELD